MNTIENCADTDWKDTAYYRTSCDCGSNEHMLTVWMDKEDDWPTLTMYFQVYGPTPYRPDKWWQRIWQRIVGAVTILFKGKIYYEEAFIFRGKDHVRDFIKALEVGLGKLENDKDAI